MQACAPTVRRRSDSWTVQAPRGNARDDPGDHHRRRPLVYPAASPRPHYTYSATYAAAQNLIVAASSFGLGAAFTILHEVAEPAFRSILGMPDDRIIAVTIPIGWPARELKPVRRKAIDTVVHHDRWRSPSNAS